MQSELDEPKESEFLARYNEIAVRKLVPEDIEKYAESVLADLSTLAEEILEKHQWDSLAGKDWEDKAFEEEGVPNIGEKLAHAAKEVEDMNTINARLDSLLEEDYVILPPEGGGLQIKQKTKSKPNKPWLHKDDGKGPNPGPNGEKQNPALKTKTILFILSQQFGEDISEEGLVKIIKGKSGSKEQRWAEQYFCIDAPNQNKIIFSCDKIDNGTFIVDKNDLAKARDDNGQPIDFEQLQKMSRAKVRKLIKEQMPNSTSVDFKDNFVEHVKNAIAKQPAPII